MLTSERIAIAAHLHVQLRRKTGRVTDTEWMASNLEYAAEIVRFSRAKAAEDNHPDLAEWADKLERAMYEYARTPQPRPLVAAATQVLRERPAPVLAPVPVAPSHSVLMEEDSVLVDGSSRFGHSVNPGESGFLESNYYDPNNPNRPRRIRDPAVPRYVGGIR